MERCKSERYQRAALVGVGLLALLGLIPLLLLSPRAGFAQSGSGGQGGNSGVGARVAALEAALSHLQNTISQLQDTNARLAEKVAALESKTQDMSRDTDSDTGQPTVRFSGVNLQVVDGSGDTGGAVNGRGNLIVGYNALRKAPLWPYSPGGDVRTGSHNLIVGDCNNYSAFGGLAAGLGNTISNEHASVSGGAFNTASGIRSSVSGGVNNTAIGEHCSVSGGGDNQADGNYATVSGGRGRYIRGVGDWRAGALFQDE